MAPARREFEPVVQGPAIGSEPRSYARDLPDTETASHAATIRVVPLAPGSTPKPCAASFESYTRITCFTLTNSLTFSTDAQDPGITTSTTISPFLLFDSKDYHHRLPLRKLWVSSSNSGTGTLWCEA